jgi:hypothetical protein
MVSLLLLFRSQGVAAAAAVVVVAAVLAVEAVAAVGRDGLLPHT